MKKYLLFFTFCAFASTIVCAQAPAGTAPASANQPGLYGDAGEVNLIVDERIGRMVQTHVREKKGKKVAGFRVQIIQGSKRAPIQEEQGRFQGMFPYIKSYVTYNAPTFKLRVGNFTNRFDAYRAFSKIKPNFKRASIVKDRVYP